MRCRLPAVGTVNALRGRWLFANGISAGVRKRLNPGLRAAQNQRVDIVRALSMFATSRFTFRWRHAELV